MQRQALTFTKLNSRPDDYKIIRLLVREKTRYNNGLIQSLSKNIIEAENYPDEFFHYQYRAINNENVYLQVFNTYKDEFKQIGHGDERGSSALILIFDLDDYREFSNIIKNYKDISDIPYCILVGAKTKSSYYGSFEDLAKEFANEKRIPYFQVDYKADQSLQDGNTFSHVLASTCHTILQDLKKRKQQEEKQEQELKQTQAVLEKDAPILQKLEKKHNTIKQNLTRIEKISDAYANPKDITWSHSREIDNLLQEIIQFTKDINAAITHYEKLPEFKTATKYHTLLRNGTKDLMPMYDNLQFELIKKCLLPTSLFLEYTQTKMTRFTQLISTLISQHQASVKKYSASGIDDNTQRRYYRREDTPNDYPYVPLIELINLITLAKYLKIYFNELIKSDKTLLPIAKNYLEQINEAFFKVSYNLKLGTINPDEIIEGLKKSAYQLQAAEVIDRTNYLENIAISSCNGDLYSIYSSIQNSLWNLINNAPASQQTSSELERCESLVRSKKAKHDVPYHERSHHFSKEASKEPLPTTRMKQAALNLLSVLESKENNSNTFPNVSKIRGLEHDAFPSEVGFVSELPDPAKLKSESGFTAKLLDPSTSKDDKKSESTFMQVTNRLKALISGTKTKEPFISQLAQPINEKPFVSQPTQSITLLDSKDPAEVLKFIQNHKGFSEAFKTHCETFHKLGFKKQIEDLGLNDEEYKQFENLLDPFTNDYFNIPVKLKKVAGTAIEIYDLSTLLDMYTRNVRSANGLTIQLTDFEPTDETFKTKLEAVIANIKAKREEATQAQAQTTSTSTSQSTALPGQFQNAYHAAPTTSTIPKPRAMVL